MNENKLTTLNSIADQILAEKYLSKDYIVRTLQSRMDEYVSAFLDSEIGEKQQLLFKLEDQKLRKPTYSDEWILLTSRIKRLREEVAVGKRLANEKRVTDRYLLRYKNLKSFVANQFRDSEELREYFLNEKINERQNNDQ